MKIKRVKIAAILAAKALLSAALVLLVLRKVHVIEVASRVQNVGWFFAPPVLMCFVAAIFLAARRWQVLSGGLISYAQALKYTWIGLFFSAILPGVVSGDLAKGASLALKDKSVRVGKLPLSIAMDRAVGLYALLGFFVLSSAALAFDSGFLSPDLKQLGLYGFVGGAAVLLLVACCAGLVGKMLGERDAAANPSGKIRVLLSRILDALNLYRHQPRLLVRAAGYSVVIHGMGVMAFYLVMRALSVNCHIVEVIIFYSILSVLISLPITISGLGIRDWFSLTFFQSFWGDGQSGVAFAWLLLVLTLILAMAGGVVQITDFFAWRSIRRSNAAASARDSE